MTGLRATIVAAAAAALLVGGCGSGGGGGGDTTPSAGGLETEEPGKLIVGSDIPYPPFEFGRGPDYEGFDIDLSREIAERLDLELEVEDTAFDTIFRDLAQGKFDMVASATTITPEREKTVTFSDPYFLAQQALVVEPGSEIASVEDLAGATVAAQKGTTGADYAENETDAEAVRTYPEGDDAFNALLAGQVDAVVIDQPVAEEAVSQKDGLEIAEPIPTDEQYGLAFGKDSTALVEAVNGALAEIKDDGTYAEIYGEYFTSEPPKEILETSG